MSQQEKQENISDDLPIARAEAILAEGVCRVGSCGVIGFTSDEGAQIALAMTCPSGCHRETYSMSLSCAEKVAKSITDALAIAKAQVN